MLETQMSPLAGQSTLIESWQALADLSPDARLERRASTLAAVFPEWAPLNNAILLEPVSDRAAATAARDLLEGYAEAGVEAWALWLPSRSRSLADPDALGSVDGMVRDTSTLVMETALAPASPRDGRVVRTSVAAAGRAGDEPVPVTELPAPDEGGGMDAWVLVEEGVGVAAAWSLLHGTDCGLYAVATVPEWRRRGLARALIQHVLADAWDRGARTATLQSTPMGEPLYRSLGFTAVGRYEEWVPKEREQ